MRVTMLANLRGLKLSRGPTASHCLVPRQYHPRVYLQLSGETRNLQYIPKRTIAQSLCFLFFSLFLSNEVYLKGDIAYLCSEGQGLG
jgi:hypothetical protein